MLTEEEIKALQAELAKAQAALNEHTTLTASMRESLTQTEARAAQLEAEKAEAERLRKEQEMKLLPLEEQLRVRQTQWEAEQRAVVEGLRKEAAAQYEQARKYHLIGHREKRLREVGGNLILSMVSGETEQEIDASIERARNEYARIAQTVRDEYAAQHQTQLDRAMTGAVPAQPPNPAVAAPLPAAPPGGGYASYPAQPQQAPVDIFGGMSPEQAVRSGKVTREQLAALYAQVGANSAVPTSVHSPQATSRVQRQAPPPSPPRHPGLQQPALPPPMPPAEPWAQPQQHPYPPQYMPPPQPPQGYADPQYAGPGHNQQGYPHQPPPPRAPFSPPPAAPPQGGQTAEEQALRAAIARTRAGQNSVLAAEGANKPAVAAHAAEVRKYQAEHGINTVEDALRIAHEYHYPNQPQV